MSIKISNILDNLKHKINRRREYISMDDKGMFDFSPEITDITNEIIDDIYNLLVILASYKDKSDEG